MHRILSFAILFSALFIGIAGAADATKPQKPTHPVYLDPANAGPDFAIQGEYAGDLAGGKGKLGVQIIALGDDEFTAVIHRGGLPGAGWDGQPRVDLKGKREGEQVNFSGNGYSASIANGTFTGKDDQGESFSLRKVERVSPDEGAKPPAGAIVLFDGTNGDNFHYPKDGKPGELDEHHNLKQGVWTNQKFQDFTLHVEFMLPFKPFGRDQDRGNSGIYIQNRYEIQVLDTFGHPEEFNGCASTYRQTAPKVNMCFPPLRWQTYDIDFTAPKWDANGKKTANARVTVRHNGVVVQDNTELTSKTGAGQKEAPEPGPIQLQEHHNPVVYRNIWIIDKK